MCNNSGFIHKTSSEECHLFMEDLDWLARLKAKPRADLAWLFKDLCFSLGQHFSPATSVKALLGLIKALWSCHSCGYSL